MKGHRPKQSREISGCSKSRQEAHVILESPISHYQSTMGQSDSGTSDLREKLLGRVVTIIDMSGLHERLPQLPRPRFFRTRINAHDRLEKDKRADFVSPSFAGTDETLETLP